MAAQGFNYFYTGLGLNTGAFRIFYGFEGTTGSAVPSLPLADTSHSGIILGNQGDFYSVGGSGTFNNTALKIQNTEGLFSKNCSFLFTHQKTGHSNGVIFSNLQGGAIRSGFAFGLNDANRLYFEYYTNQGPQIRTSSKILSDKNMLAVRINGETLSFDYYHPNLCSLSSEVFNINPDYLLPSNDWYLGSGVGQNPYRGHIDNFVYIDEGIPYSDLGRLFSGFYTDINIRTGSPQLVGTGTITGYHSSTTGVTGVIGSYFVPSGVDLSSVDYATYNTQVATGNLVSGQEFYEVVDQFPFYCSGDHDRPVFKKSIAQSQGTGITGFTQGTGFYTDYLESNVYSEVFETGMIHSGQVLTPLYDTEGVVVSGKVSEVAEINTGYLNSFGMTSVTYLGLRGEDSDISEHYVATGQVKVDNIGIPATFDAASREFRSFRPELRKPHCLFLNGVAQVTGEIFTTGDIYHQGIDVTNDYAVSGSQVIFNKFADSNDHVIYDSSPHDFYIASYLSPFDVVVTYPLASSLCDLWMNGQKLISGIDYIGTTAGVSIIAGEGTGYNPSEDVIYFTETPLGSAYNSGEYDFYSSRFLRDTTRFYLNGVRVSPQSYVEHSSEVDLITGLETVDKALDTFYIRERDFWDEYS